MDMMKHHVAQQTLDATIASAASKTTYTGASVTLGGWLVSSEAAVLAGIVLGLAGFVVNLYFRSRADAREEREHHARMTALRGQQPGA
jgi:hypothetical protein